MGSGGCAASLSRQVGCTGMGWPGWSPVFGGGCAPGSASPGGGGMQAEGGHSHGTCLQLASHICLSGGLR